MTSVTSAAVRPPISSAAQEAVTLIQDHARVLIGSGAAAPSTLIEALCRRAPPVSSVEVCQLLTLASAPYLTDAFVGHIRHNAFFIGGNVRDAVQSGRADFTPIFLSEIPDLLRGSLPIDVALVQVSPPDRHGYCSLGVSVDIVKPAIDSARYVIAEINPRMPRSHGDAFISFGKIARFVEVDTPIPEASPEPIGDVESAIGRHVATLVRDGDTIQTGIGAIPNAVLAALSSHRDLGVHTEMFSDGVVDLVEKGVITNARKTHRPGKTIASFVLGTRRVYDFIDDNPSVEMRPSDYVNDPFVIARNRGMVAINSALSVDLTGQVCADSIGSKFFSGVGGQVDFFRGAARAPDGRAIIALPSTAKGGAISRIVAELAPGAGVTTTRNDVHFVVTEYGIAALHGKSVRERVRALVDIAHPQYREDLLRAARERRWG